MLTSDQKRQQTTQLKHNTCLRSRENQLGKSHKSKVSLYAKGYTVQDSKDDTPKRQTVKDNSIMEDHPVKGSHSGLDAHSETHTGVNAMEMQPPTAGMVPMSVSPEQIRFILELRRKLAQTHVSNGHGRPMRNESTAGAFAYCFFWVTCTCEEWDHIIADYPEEFLGDYQERMQERAQFGGGALTRLSRGRTFHWQLRYIEGQVIRNLKSQTGGVNEFSSGFEKHEIHHLPHYLRL